MRGYAGIAMDNIESMTGRNTARRNAKRKSRLPYHAKRHLQLPVMGKQDKCAHSLSRHEELSDVRGNQVMVSYAIPCQVGHKRTTKSPVHKDTIGRKWQ